MKYVFYTHVVSPHQIPWCNKFAELVGLENFIYIAVASKHPEREKLGWQIQNFQITIVLASNAGDLLETAEVLISGIRDDSLFNRRKKLGLRTFYTSERWLKPPLGIFRLLSPQYLIMCLRFVELIKWGKLKYLPIGISAARDMARLIGLFSGDLRCLWRSPLVKMRNREPLSSFEIGAGCSKGGANLSIADNLRGALTGLYGLERMRLWGYFVEPSKMIPLSTDVKPEKTALKSPEILSILWVGRMLAWKRVDMLVKVVVRLLEEGMPLQLKVIGYGPMENKLRQMAGGWLIDNQGSTYRMTQRPSAVKMPIPASSLSLVRGIKFSAPVPIADVRKLMQESDVYVLPSDGGEGWGAVVNEAMAEGSCVIGTYEAGSSATMIEDGVNGFVYSAGDGQALYERLRKIINSECLLQSNRTSTLNIEEIRKISEQGRKTVAEIWSPDNAARKLYSFLKLNGC